MPSNELVPFANLESLQIVRSPGLTHGLPVDIYLLPYTLDEFLHLETIPERSFEKVQQLKMQHIYEVYEKTVQLPFSALVLSHKEISYFRKRISKELGDAARSTTLLPEHCATLDAIFSGSKSTQIRGPHKTSSYDGSATYETLAEMFDVVKTFFRHEPGSGQERGYDLIHSGWFYEFGDMISVQFDPWFRSMDCTINTNLWSYFTSRFPQVPNNYVEGLMDPALASRMAVYVGLCAPCHKRFVQATYNLFSSVFDLHGFEYPGITDLSGKYSRYAVIGTRKQAYPIDVPQIALSSLE